jgi:multiple sugar transport system permease protein
MAAPAVLAVLTILAFPALYNLYLSFTNASALTGVSNPDFVGIANYQTVFRDARFQRALGLTVTWTVANLVLQLGLGLGLAILLHDTRGRLGGVLRALWVLPWLLPAASAFYVWRLLFNPDVGGPGALLAQLGVSQNVIGDPSVALWAVIVAGAWKGFPFYMLMLYSGLASVDRDLYDAARVDGASRWRVLRDIELPEIRPILGLATILGFVWIFNWMTPLLVMTEGGPGGATTTLGLYTYFEALRGFRLANAAVASTVLVAIVLVIFLGLYLRRRQQRGEGSMSGQWSGG